MPSGNGARRLLTKRRVFAVGAGMLACCIVALGVWAYNTWRNQTVELQSGGVTILHRDYVTMMAQAKKHGVSEQDARSMLQKSIHAQDAAAQLGITQADYRDAASLAAINTFKLSPNATPNEYQLTSQYPAGINTYLTYAEQGGYRFAIFKFPFSRAMWDSTQEAKKRETTVRADLVYAKQQAESYRTQLQDSRTTPERIVQALRDDDRLAYGYGANDSQILTVGAMSSRQLAEGVTVQYDKALVAQLAKLKVGTISDIQEEVAPIGRGMTPPTELQAGEYQMKVGYMFTKLLDKRDPAPGLTVRYSTKLREVSRD